MNHSSSIWPTASPPPSVSPSGDIWRCPTEKLYNWLPLQLATNFPNPLGCDTSNGAFRFRTMIHHLSLSLFARSWILMKNGSCCFQLNMGGWVGGGCRINCNVYWKKCVNFFAALNSFHIFVRFCSPNKRKDPVLLRHQSFAQSFRRRWEFPNGFRNCDEILGRNDKSWTWFITKRQGLIDSFFCVGKALIDSRNPFSLNLTFLVRDVSVEVSSRKTKKLSTIKSVSIKISDVLATSSRRSS